MKKSPDRPLARGVIEKRLFPGPGLPGGGQLEVRMEVPFLNPDPDVQDVARRFQAYNLDSWHSEWTRVAEKNEQLAQGFEKEDRHVTAHEFADGILLRGQDSEANQYVRRGMSFIDVDGPGQGATLREKKLYAPPDSERVARAVIDYLVTRPDVDPNRIGVHGSSMGGYSGPRCATVEKRIKAVACWSGAYNLVDDIFDYYPPIQDRLRWLMGAKDLKEARKQGSKPKMMRLPATTWVPVVQVSIM